MINSYTLLCISFLIGFALGLLTTKLYKAFRRRKAEKQFIDHFRNT